MKKVETGINLCQQKVTPPLWSINYVLILCSSMGMFFSFSILLPTLPIYIETFSGSSYLAGTAATTLSLAAVIIRPFSGWALDMYGRKNIFLGGLVLFLIPSVIYISMVPFAVLIFLRFVQGLGWGICNTASGTVAADMVPRERIGEGIGFYGISSSIPMTVAPALGLWLLDDYSFTVLFVVSSSLIVFSIAIALFIRYEKVEKPVIPSKLSFMEKKTFKPALIILFISIISSSGISFLALFALQQGLAGGLFFTVMAIGTILSRPLSGIIVDRVGKRGYDLVVIINILILILSLLVIARISTSLHLVTGGVLFGFSYGSLQSAMLSLSLNNTLPEKKGAANASYWTAVDLGVACGSIICGILAGAFGYSTMFHLMVIPAIIALSLYLILKD